jgi:hypothetical protein
MTPKHLIAAEPTNTAKCMNCGGWATSIYKDHRGPVIITTSWCDLHAPDLWEFIARARRRALNDAPEAAKRAYKEAYGLA